MHTYHLEELRQQTIILVQKVAGFLATEKGKVRQDEIEEKSRNSLVSYVDKTAEKMLVEGLQSILPEAVFITEEETIEQANGDWRWIIDPLDGTTNFLHQLPCFSISVALQYKENTVVGVVHEVNQNETFSAHKNGGAWLNEAPIFTTKTDAMANALVATGFPYYDYDHIDAYLDVFRYLMKETRGIRRFGSAAVDLVYVACGRFDAYFEYSLNAWDVAAGALIVQEAGGIVVDFSGGDNYLFGREIIAVNAPLSEAFAALINKSFKNQ